MMYYYDGGAGWLGILGVGLGMIAFWAIVIGAVVWAIRSSRRDSDRTSPTTGALGILQGCLARGRSPARSAPSRAF